MCTTELKCPSCRRSDRRMTTAFVEATQRAPAGLWSPHILLKGKAWKYHRKRQHHLHRNSRPPHRDTSPGSGHARPMHRVSISPQLLAPIANQDCSRPMLSGAPRGPVPIHLLLALNCPYPFFVPPLAPFFLVITFLLHPSSPLPLISNLRMHPPPLSCITHLDHSALGCNHPASTTNLQLGLVLLHQATPSGSPIDHYLCSSADSPSTRPTSSVLERSDDGTGLLIS